MAGINITISDGTVDELEDRIWDWLTGHRDAYHNQRKTGDQYSSAEHLIRDEGKAFHANIWEMTVNDLAPGQCFLNAFMLSQINPRWRYYEGWALMPFSIPTHHAWVVDEDDVVQDPTWKPLYRRYRDADANRGSKQPYSGAAAYVGVSVDPTHHLNWTLTRGQPNILAIGDFDIAEVMREGVATALQRKSAEMGLATYP